eukprot:3999303-Pleurochrysis_carterae.AAC.1
MNPTRCISPGRSAEWRTSSLAASDQPGRTRSRQNCSRQTRSRQTTCAAPCSRQAAPPAQRACDPTCHLYRFLRCRPSH